MAHPPRLARAPRASDDLHQIIKLAQLYLMELDTPRSLTVYILLDAYLRGETDVALEIVTLKLDPSLYVDHERFRRDYQATELLRKFSGFVSDALDPEATALESYFEAERKCAETNRRLVMDAGDCFLDRILDRAASHIRGLLGPVDNCVRQMPYTGAWGKGVTSSQKGKWLTEYHKLNAVQHVTPSFSRLGSSFWKEATLGLDDREILIIQGSKTTFVPKNARTHRSIAIEPSVNLFAQRAIGKYIRERLYRKWRLDLRSQTRNQNLARSGSIDGALATLDLSAASDTVSRGIVERLLPPDWFALMDVTRSKFTEVNGRPWLLSKFSSMGNGFTFELETLIFSALVRAVIDDADWYADNWAVYGDDIIVPTQTSEDVCNVLAYCGFSLNEKKSFVSGPFRESCGADFFLGVPVRPHLVKDKGDSALETWANWLYRQPVFCRKTWDSIVWTLGPSYPRGPQTIDSGVLHCEGILPFSFVSPPVIRRGFVGRIIRVRVWVPQTITSRRVDGWAAAVANLRTLVARAPLGLGRRLVIDSQTPLPEPWVLSTRGSGKWVTKKRFIIY